MKQIESEWTKHLDKESTKDCIHLLE